LWLAISCVLSALAATSSLTLSLLAVRRANRALASRPASLRSVELRLQSAEELAQEHTQVLTDLTNRLKMMKVRKASAHGSKVDDELPDPYTDPDRWRVAMTRKIALNKLNGG